MFFKRGAKEIKNPIEFLKKWVPSEEDTYTISEKMVSDVSMNVCRSWEDDNNCTLVALCNIMQHYAKEDYPMISKDIMERYKVVRKQAALCGYDGKKGIPVYKNRKFANLFCRAMFAKKQIKARARYLISKRRAIASIDANQPFLLSLASGYYFDHTVAVYGYANYTNNRTGKTYTFLMLADGWHDSCRYLAWTHTRAKHITCMTQILGLS